MTKEDVVKKIGSDVRALYSQPQSTVSTENDVIFNSIF